MARKQSYDTKETENMKASHNLFMDSFNIFNQTLTVISQYTDLLKDISHKLQNIYNKSINILFNSSQFCSCLSGRFFISSSISTIVLSM